MSCMERLEAVGKIKFGSTGELELVFRVPSHATGANAMNRLVEIITNIIRAEKGWAYEISTSLRTSTQTAREEDE